MSRALRGRRGLVASPALVGPQAARASRALLARLVLRDRMVRKGSPGRQAPAASQVSLGYMDKQDSAGWQVPPERLAR